VKELTIISELCGQFGGSMRRAEQMMLQSKMGGADYVKVQLYDTYRMPGENRELWEYLSMTKPEFEQMKRFADSLNLGFFASAFHKDRFNWIRSTLSINKIASSLLISDFELCTFMVESKMFTFCSLGKWKEEELPFDSDNIVYMHCLCEYPHHYKRAIEVMPQKFEGKRIGYSDHCIGIEACKEAVRRGALFIEKHFTTDHNLDCKTEGAHLCSMDYDELVELRNFCDEYARKS
jgi:N,N'-diacetyllegionaminate synthase